MMREQGLGDQVSETDTQTETESAITPLSEKRYKPLEMPTQIPEESETEGQGGTASQKEHLKSVAKAFGKAINQNISKIVPQKDVSGPYGQPLMLK